MSKKILYNRIGGKTSETIVKELMKNPLSAAQLSLRLRINLKAVYHHLHILKKYRYISEEKFGHTILYFPTNLLLKEVM